MNKLEFIYSWNKNDMKKKRKLADNPKHCIQYSSFFFLGTISYSRADKILKKVGGGEAFNTYSLK